MTTIRTALPGEAPVITAIINRAYRVEDFFKIGDRTDEPEVRRYMAADMFLVAEDNSGRIVGSVRVSGHDGQGHFGLLAVEPDQQGSGLGRRLIDAAEAWARERGCTSMWLEAVNLREELPPYYRRLGYEISGTQPWPEDSLERISRPAHFIIMNKQLAAAAPAGEARR